MKSSAPHDLGRKLGLRSGMRVGLTQVPPLLEDLLRRSAPAEVRWSRRAGRVRIDMFTYMPRGRAELAAAWRRLQSWIIPDGAIWVIVPRKPVAEKRGLDFRWEDGQAAALETDLVDN